MKVRTSVKSLKAKDGAVVVRRKGKTYVINTNTPSTALNSIASYLDDGTGQVLFDLARYAPFPGVSPPPATPGGEPAKPPETRIVVVGDSDFAANAGLGIQGNRDLFMNMLGWLSQQENLISIRPKDADDRRITLTAAQQSNITWLTLIIIPACVFGTGVYTWWRRR